MVEKRSYVIGRISAIKRWEGFGIDYFLPQGTDEGGYYAETCVAIGVMIADRTATARRCFFFFFFLGSLSPNVTVTYTMTFRLSLTATTLM